MTRVSMEIPSDRASLFAKVFEDEGLDVSWDAPFEKRSGGVAELVQIVYYLKSNAGAGVVGGASYAAVQAAIKKIREKFPSVKVKSEDDPAEDGL